MSKKSTTATLRCFIAIAAPLLETAKPLIEELQRFARVEKTRLRIVPAGNLHVTLKFIGEVTADQTGLLDSILRHQSARQPALTLHCHGLGFFSNSLYLGIKENDALSQLVENLNEAFAFLGYPIEEMKFLPHITLARFAAPARPELVTSLEAYRGREWGEFTVESIQLYRSETLPRGARYTSIGSHTLTLR